VQSESEAAAQRVKDLLTGQLSGNWPGFEVALSAATDPKTRRNAMVYLASQTQATLARDAFLVADDAMLEKMLGELASRVAEVKPVERSDAKLAALLEISTLRFLGQLLAENHLPAELGSVLTDYAGEAGRHVSSIEQVSAKLADRGELQSKLIVENRIFLEDASPAARVRAYDWLKSRQAAPKGFDPLGNPRDRREALQNVDASALGRVAP
jgi:hypothetical protein